MLGATHLTAESQYFDLDDKITIELRVLADDCLFIGYPGGIELVLDGLSKDLLWFYISGICIIGSNEGNYYYVVDTHEWYLKGKFITGFELDLPQSFALYPVFEDNLLLVISTFVISLVRFQELSVFLTYVPYDTRAIRITNSSLQLFRQHLEEKNSLSRFFLGYDPFTLDINLQRSPWALPIELSKDAILCNIIFNTKYISRGLFYIETPTGYFPSNQWSEPLEYVVLSWIQTLLDMHNNREEYSNLHFQGLYCLRIKQEQEAIYWQCLRWNLPQAFSLTPIFKTSYASFCFELMQATKDISKQLRLFGRETTKLDELLFLFEKIYQTK